MSITEESVVIEVSMKNVIHLEQSYYNNNFYQLPFKIFGQDVLYERYDGGDYFSGIQLGKIVDGKFVNEGSYWLNDESAIDETQKLIWIDEDKIEYFNLFK